MSARAKSWALKARADLLDILGANCANCGTTENLTFDCIQPTGDDHHRGSTDQRMLYYRKQRARDNCQVLCDVCNAQKGDKTIDYRPLPEVAAGDPF